MPTAFELFGSSYGQPKKKYTIEKPKERYSAIPEDYQFMPDRSALGPTYEKAPTAGAKFSNLPMGGQYVIDQIQGNPLIKSARKDENTALIRNGLPGFAVQVDHIIPLWAGGSDNDENKQVLSNKQHAQKTKVDAVLSTLYYAGKISISEARAGIMNWKNKDVEGIEATDGKLSEDSQEALTKALAIKQRWDNPGPIKISLDDVVDEAKKNPLVRGIGAAINAFTLGWINPNKDVEVEKGQETETAVAETIGSLAGTLASFATGQGIVAGAARVLKLGNLAKAWSAGKYLKGADAAVTAGKVEVGTGLIGKVLTKSGLSFDDLAKVTDSKIGKAYISTKNAMTERHLGQKLATNVGLMTGMGQLSKEAYDGDRVHRFMSDVAFGTLVSLPGQTLKSYAGLATGVYTLGKLEGASDKDALLNSAIMVGFHGLAHPARQRMIEQGANTESFNYRFSYGREGVPVKINPLTGKKATLEEMPALFNAKLISFTPKELYKWDQSIEGKLRIKAKYNPTKVTSEVIEEELSRLAVTSRQLYKGGLGREQSLRESVMDIKSMFKRENLRTQEDGVLPEVYKTKIDPQFENVFELGSVAANKKQKAFIAEKRGEMPLGRTPASGTTFQEKGEAITLAYENGLREGNNVLVVRRSDQKEFLDSLKGKKDSLGEQNLATEHTLEIYAPVDGKMRRIGYIPTDAYAFMGEKSLLSKGRLWDSAKHPRGTEQIPFTEKKTYPTNQNVGKFMEDNGIEFLSAPISYIAPARGGKEASLSLNLIPESYTLHLAGKEPVKEARLTEQGENIHRILAGDDSFYGRLSAEKRESLEAVRISRLLNKNSQAVPSEIREDFNTALGAQLQEVAAAIRSNSVKRVQEAFSEGFGLKISKEGARKFLGKKKAVTVGDVMGTLERAKERAQQTRSIQALRAPEPAPAKTADKQPTLPEKTEQQATAPETIQKEIRTEKVTEAGTAEPETKKIEAEKRDEIDQIKETNSTAEESLEALEKKERTYKDWGIFNNGLQLPLKTPFDAAFEKAHQSNDIVRVERLQELKEGMNRKAMEEKAKTAYQSKGHERGYQEFERHYTDLLRELDADLKLTADDIQALRHQYTRLYQNAPRKVLRLKGNTLEEGELSAQPSSFFMDRKAKYLKENPDCPEFEMFYFDAKNSIFDKKIKAPGDQKQALYSKLKEDGRFMPIATTDKTLKNILIMEKSPYMVEKFEEGVKRDPMRYLLDEKEFSLYQKNPEAFSEETKQLRVLAYDVLGFEPGMKDGKILSPAGKVIKRLKLADSRETYVPKELFPHLKEGFTLNVLKSPKLKDTPELIADFKAWEGVGITKKDIEDAFDKALFDGKIFMLKEDVNRITQALGFVGKRNQLKPTFSALDEKLGLAIQKGDISVLDDFYTAHFEKILGRKIKSGDIITFGDNIKVAQNDIKARIKSEQVTELPMAVESMRVKYSNPHHHQGSYSPSITANFWHDDRVAKALVKTFGPEVKKISDFVRELGESNSGAEIKAVFAKYPEYNKNLDRDLHDKVLKKINNGAGKYLANQQLAEIANKLFEKRILKGSFLKSDHLTLSVDIGVVKNPDGTRRYLRPGEVMMSRSTWKRLSEGGKEGHVMTVRYPVTHKLAMSKDKVLIAEDHGIHHLGDNQIILSHRDVIVTKQGDTDGDSVHVFFVGEGGIPAELADNIEKTRQKGDMVLEKLDDFDDLPISDESFSAITDKIILGNDGINMTSATKRVMPAVVDAKTKIKITNKGGKRHIFITVGEKDMPITEEGITTKTKFKKGDDVTYILQFDEKSQRITAQVLQESVDSAQTKNLSAKRHMDKSFDINYLYSRYVGTDDKDVLQGVKAALNYFQIPFTLDKKMESSATLFDAIKTANTRSRFIEESGGKIGPMQEILRLFEGAEGLVDTRGNRKLQTAYDQLGRKAVIEKYQDRFRIGDDFQGKDNFVLKTAKNKNIRPAHIKHFLKELRAYKEAYDEAADGINVPGYISGKGLNKAQAEFNKEAIKEHKKQLRIDFYGKWEQMNGKYNQDEKDAIAYYLTTAYDANLSFKEDFFNPKSSKMEYFTFRLEDIFNDISPEVAKVYNRGAESLDWKAFSAEMEKNSDAAIQKTIAEKNTKKASEVLESMLNSGIELTEKDKALMRNTPKASQIKKKLEEKDKTLAQKMTDWSKRSPEEIRKTAEKQKAELIKYKLINPEKKFTPKQLDAIYHKPFNLEKMHKTLLDAKKKTQ